MSRGEYLKGIAISSLISSLAITGLLALGYTIGAIIIAIIQAVLLAIILILVLLEEYIIKKSKRELIKKYKVERYVQRIRENK